jgi:hypothetical protein
VPRRTPYRPWPPAPEQPLRRAREQLLAGAVHQPQTPVPVEGEDGDLDLGHDGFQQRLGFHRAETLRAQRLAQRVHLAHDFAERVLSARAARADRVVAFVQRSEQIRDRLQRPDDPLAQRQRAQQPCSDREDRERPPHLVAVVAEPEQPEGDEDGRRARQQRVEQDAAFEGHGQLSVVSCQLSVVNRKN